MHRRIALPTTTTALALGLCAAFSAFAADPITDAMQDANAPCRAALVKTNGANQPEAQQATAQAQQSWARLVERYSAKPPAPYDHDAAFSESMAAVSKALANASEQASANRFDAAHASLERARDTLAELRRRNRVLVYSDHVDAYHSEMEVVMGNGSKILSQPNGIARLTALSGALNYLAERLATEAPEKHAKSEEFQSLVKAVQKSVSDLQAALFAQDATAVEVAIGKLKAPYAKLFLKFG
jgi:hypothetical protein